MLADFLTVHPDLTVVVNGAEMEEHGPFMPVRRDLEPLPIPAAAKLSGFCFGELCLPARRHIDRPHVRQTVWRIALFGIGRKLPTAVEGDLDAGHVREGSSLKDKDPVTYIT